MKVVNISQWNPYGEADYAKTVVCIGKFDGIHCGHRLLIREAADRAKKSGWKIVMLTFLFAGVETIYSREEKTKLAESLGIDVMAVCPVTEEFMHLSPEAFIEDYLYRRLHAKGVVVGEDFRFGFQRAGDASLLKKAGERYGFDVCILEKLRQDGEVVSSTRIRKAILLGEMEQAASLLAAPYFIRGVVRQGNQIGRKMSVPTANIVPAAGKVIPPFGAYAVRIMADGRQYDGVGNLGIKPTIPGENPAGLEVWLFDYEGNLYGKEITVSLISFLRQEKKFESVDQLQAQIMTDTRRAKEILAGTKGSVRR